MKIFGYTIEKKSDFDELTEAKRVLDKHGFRAVRVTTDKSNKQASAKKANEAKIKITNDKLQNGLELWRMEGDQDKPLTAYRLGKLAGVSQNTAKKFLADIQAL